MIQTATYPDIAAQKADRQTVKQWVESLAFNHMHNVDTDFAFEEAAAWVSARSQKFISYYTLLSIYHDACKALGWDGVIGSAVGMRSVLPDDHKAVA